MDTGHDQVDVVLPLKVINLWAGPGAGKSTTAAGLFNLMKSRGMSVELVTEFAKEATYEKNYGTLQNQLLILAQQDTRLRRLVGHSEWAITDSPLPLGLAYITGEYREWLPDTIWGAYDRYDNWDFYITRVKPYATQGRNQTEAEARALDNPIRVIFGAATTGERAWEFEGDEKAPYRILREIMREGQT